MAAYTYQYKVRGLQKAPAQVAGEVCEKLQNSPGGLTPKTLVEASRDKDAPLHGEFEWRDDVAAELYRENQAGGIIRNIVIVSEEQDKPDRAFVSTPGRTGNYVALDAALNNAQWSAHLLEQAKSDMVAFLAKYRRVERLTKVNAAISDFLKTEAVAE